MGHAGGPVSAGDVPVGIQGDSDSGHEEDWRGPCTIMTRCFRTVNLWVSTFILFRSHLFCSVVPVLTHCNSMQTRRLAVGPTIDSAPSRIRIGLPAHLSYRSHGHQNRQFSTIMIRRWAPIGPIGVS